MRRDTTHLIKDAGKRLGRQVGRYAKERPAFTASLAMHVALILLVTVGLPAMWEKKRPEPPRIVSVDLLPIREKTNVKPQEAAPEIKQEKPKKENPKQMPTSKPEPKPEAKPDPKPTPVKKPPVKEAPKPKPKPEKKPVKKPDPKPKKEAEKPKENDFEKLMKNLAEEKQNQKKQEKQQAEYAPTRELSASLRDAIQGALQKELDPRWEIPIGGRDAADLQVSVTFTIKPDGKTTNVELVDKARYRPSDPVFMAAADSALRAVHNADFKDMMARFRKEYEFWKRVEYTFRAHDSFY